MLPKNLKLTIAWIILASFLCLAAFWQAQIAVAKEMQARHKEPPPPLKTRHAIRPVPPRISSGDAIAVYVNRQKKGLTDQEIGWIIEDFKNAGLDLSTRVAPKEDYLAQRWRQDRWYHDALVEAWSLSPEQSAEVTTKLAELYHQASSEFLDELAKGPPPFESGGKWYSITTPVPIQRLINPPKWLLDPTGRFLPWNLCTMAPEHVIKNADAFTSEADLFIEIFLPSHVESPAEPSTPTAAEVEKTLEQVRKLHPAHFKLQLLLHPEMAADIEKKLDAGSK